MIKALIRRGITRFEKRYSYDASYMRHVTDISTAAGWRLMALPIYAQYAGPPAARDVWAGAALGSTLDGDCGPCVQLVVDIALEAGVAEDQLALCLQGLASEDTAAGLGFLFARATIADSPVLDHLRDQIDARFGAEAVVACSFAAAGGRVYPVMKRGLGFGHVCTKVRIAGQDLKVAHQT